MHPRSPARGWHVTKHELQQHVCPEQYMRSLSLGFKNKGGQANIQLQLRIPKSSGSENSSQLLPAQPGRVSSLGFPGDRPHLRWPPTVLPPHREGVLKCESAEETGEHQRGQQCPPRSKQAEGKQQCTTQ